MGELAAGRNERHSAQFDVAATTLSHCNRSPDRRRMNALGRPWAAREETLAAMSKFFIFIYYFTTFNVKNINNWTSKTTIKIV